MPVRVQRRRTKGWQMPANTIYVGRPTRWGNDWTLKDAGIRGEGDPRKQREWAIAAYRADVEWCANVPGSTLHLPDIIAALRGKNLACWCPLDQPCHADVLLEVANA